VRWTLVACAGEVRSEIEATDASSVTPAIHDAGSRVSRLTTRIVNAFQTNHATRLFQVVSGGCDRIGPIAFSTCRERNSPLAAMNLRPTQGCPPLTRLSRTLRAARRCLPLVGILDSRSAAG
jgi:hypothetical protein